MRSEDDLCSGRGIQKFIEAADQFSARRVRSADAALNFGHSLFRAQQEPHRKSSNSNSNRHPMKISTEEGKKKQLQLADGERKRKKNGDGERKKKEEGLQKRKYRDGGNWRKSG